MPIWREAAGRYARGSGRRSITSTVCLPAKWTLLPRRPSVVRIDFHGWKPNDPRYNEQWNFRMVNAEEAWEVTRGKGAVVAVIDTGVAFKDTKKGKRCRDFGDTSLSKATIL